MRDEREKPVAAGGWMYSLIVDRDSQPGRNTQQEIGEVHKPVQIGAQPDTLDRKERKTCISRKQEFFFFFAHLSSPLLPLVVVLIQHVFQCWGRSPYFNVYYMSYTGCHFHPKKAISTKINSLFLISPLHFSLFLLLFFSTCLFILLIALVVSPGVYVSPYH